MPADDGNDLVAAVAAEIAKQLPVKAATEPGAVQAGALGADLMKCIRLALFPIRYGAEQFDRYDRFVRINAEAVELSNRIEPAPKLVGPILEGIRYEPEGSMTDEAFGQLLRRAFDRERSGQAHPAFPAIIRSLADDEIEMLKKVRLAPIQITYGRMVDLDDVRDEPPETHDHQFSYLSYPRQVLAYVTHLEALGLLQTLIGNQGEFVMEGGVAIHRLYWNAALSDFGRLFALAVLPDDHTEA